MFSGIVRAIGVIHEADLNGDVTRMVVESSIFLNDIQPGDSISVSGCCLTVVSLKGDKGTFDLASETLRRTRFENSRVGELVNLEPSLRLGDKMDGHVVQGHVDCVGAVLSVAEESNNTKRIEVALPAEIAKFVIPKGSITIDGVSLTVGEVTAQSFSVYVIPYTQSHTTLGSISDGNLVNLEADCLAKYVDGILKIRSA